MAIVGFSFTKITAERKPVGEQAVNIESNAGVSNITEMPVIDPKKSIIKFEFDFLVKYEPDAGRIELKGEVIEMYDKEFSTKVLEYWSKDKKIHGEVMQEVFNNILSRSNIEAVVISRDLGLPSPIQMPRVDVKPVENKPKGEFKVEKIDKGKK